jgi:hypothetical protein
MFKALFGSKKFALTFVGVLIAAAEGLGLGIPIHVFNVIEGLIGSFVVGQGIADNGKEAAKVQLAEAAAKLISR